MASCSVLPSSGRSLASVIDASWSARAAAASTQAAALVVPPAASTGSGPCWILWLSTNTQTATEQQVDERRT